MFELCDIVLCMVIVLMEEGTYERLKGITLEAVSVRNMLEKCTKIF